MYSKDNRQSSVQTYSPIPLSESAVAGGVGVSLSGTAEDL